MIMIMPLKSQETRVFKYFAGTTSPDANWQAIDFDDSVWPLDSGSIGYGDGDDSVWIEETTSLYIRHKLKLSESTANSAISFTIFADYDDGFIAYLNGIEILRVNIDKAIAEPGNNQTTLRSHEALGYRLTGDPRRFDISGFFIDSIKLAGCSPDTMNILSFAVFNDSIGGSDLTFYFDYSMTDTSTASENISNRDFISAPLSDSTELPYLIIETDEYGVSEESTIAELGIINNPSKPFNHVTDGYADYDGRIRLKLHGSYSLNFPKKSLRIELQDSLGNNNNVSLLGLPPENDFILYAPYQDKTLIKNVFTYNLSRKMGYYAPRTQFCEVVLNGRNLGLYVLTEKIKRDRNRVNISRLNTDDNYGISVTGGYILAYNYGLEIIYPDPADITQEQENYILGHIATCDSLVQHINYCSTENAYSDYIDLQTVADYFLMNELSYNFDEFARSWYLYKDNDAIDGRIKYGPLWDYDVAWNYYIGQGVEGWRRYDSPILNFDNIVRDTMFSHLLIDKWNNYRLGILSDSSISGLIDSITTSIAPSITRNYQVWPAIQYTEYGEYTGRTYTDWLSEMKSWIEGRLHWMDENIGYFMNAPICNSSLNDGGITTEGLVVNCYPNPFVDEVKAELLSSKSEKIQISIYGLTGSIIVTETFLIDQGKNEVSILLPRDLSAGFYTVSIMCHDRVVFNQKIIKVKQP